jgi:hypothetical protein
MANYVDNDDLMDIIRDLLDEKQERAASKVSMTTSDVEVQIYDCGPTLRIDIKEVK